MTAKKLSPSEVWVRRIFWLQIAMQIIMSICISTFPVWGLFDEYLLGGLALLLVLLVAINLVDEIIEVSAEEEQEEDDMSQSLCQAHFRDQFQAHCEAQRQAPSGQYL